MRVLVDSCILIDHLLARDEATRYLGSLGAAAISQITWVEVMVGARTAEEERVIRALLGLFEVLPVDAEVAEEAVRLRRDRRLKLPDALVLATARVHGRTLVTRNTRDFGEREGVAVPYGSAGGAGRRSR